MATASNISVVVPLYNKAAEIERTLRSVLEQSCLPLEVIVVDDGSTDGSAEIVEAIDSSLIKLVRQENRGVSAARNRAIELARGEWIALLDGDDIWTKEHIEDFAQLIERCGDCGAIGKGFYIDDGHTLTLGDSPKSEGVVDFFTESMTRYVLIPSATLLRRSLVIELGGFPEGMRMGEDQFLWTKIARRAEVYFSPKPTVIYSRAATNRSAAIYRAEQTRFSLEQLYDPEALDLSNEYIARVALGKAIVESARGGSEAARRALEFYSYNRLSRRAYRKLRVLNSLPAPVRPTVLAIYNWFAWVIARKGV